jgi:hypothetical protein
MKAREHLAIVHRQVASILSNKILLKSLSLLAISDRQKASLV